MLKTPQHHITYPARTNIAKNTSNQFRTMAESIDDNIDNLHSQVTDIDTTTATDTKKWQDETASFTATSGNLQDIGLATLIRDVGSETRGALYGRSCLFIGDSYTEGLRASSSSRRWSTLLAKAMGWNEYNFASGGSGFSLPGLEGRTFLDQAKYAREQKLEPDVIIVAGGRNDGKADVIGRAQELFDYLHNSWPSAKVVTIPIMWDCTAVTTDALARADEIRSAAYNTGVYVVWDAWTWLYGHPEWAYDLGGGVLDMHPNDNGYLTISRYAQQALLGGQTTITLAKQLLPARNFSQPTTASVLINHGMVHIEGQFNSPSPVYTGWDFTTIPAPARPASDRYVLGYTAYGATPLLIKVSASDGVCLINNIYGSAGKGVGMPDICWPVAQ
ncbi:SGNH/GDSL hydrolase family protein [Bifidobacterium choladohabitans]|uniref:SGNH/GDSL hydrolase family protein n=1 Tax=Bifidobacterium choladohabitans TaxID=2750947 RepID=UPI0018DC5DE8|nr:SGNH/GDSL hydrolase family protein [Bifidobacterium choladohabitans]MBI0047715.1 SGNH/GDSL hydrolase family protein [Bifidobacterium choladohabitans]